VGMFQHRRAGHFSAKTCQCGAVSNHRQVRTAGLRDQRRPSMAGTSVARAPCPVLRPASGSRKSRSQGAGGPARRKELFRWCSTTPAVGLNKTNHASERWGSTAPQVVPNEANIHSLTGTTLSRRGRSCGHPPQRRSRRGYCGQLGRCVPRCGRATIVAGGQDAGSAFRRHPRPRITGVGTASSR
jgi:hypothetical protein